MSRTILLAALVVVGTATVACPAPGGKHSKEETKKGSRKPTLPFKEIKVPAGRALNFVLARDGAKVAVGVGATVTLWNVADGKECLRLQLPTTELFHYLAFAADGKTLVWNGYKDPLTRVFDLQTGRQLREFPQPDPSKKEREARKAAAAQRGNGAKEESHEFTSALLCYSPDGTRAVYRNRDKGVDLHDSTTGKLLGHIDAEKWWQTPVFTPDGKHFVCYTTADGIRFYSIETGKLVRVLKEDKRFPASGTDFVSFSRDGKYLAAWAHPQQSVDVWDVRTAKRLCTVPTRQPCYQAHFSRDNQSLLIFNSYSEVLLHNLVVEKVVHQFYPPENHIVAVAFTPDDKRVVILGDSSVVPPNTWQSSLYLHELPARLLDLRAARIDDVPPAKLWPDLFGDNDLRLQLARKAFRTAPKEAVALFRTKLPPVAQERQQQVEGWLAQLDDADYTKRDLAMKQVQGVAHAFAPLLEARHRSAGPGEVRNRLRFVLDQMSREKPPTALVGAVRVVELLEQLATPEARKLLRELAGGAPQARLTLTARAALDRLGGTQKR